MATETTKKKKVESTAAKASTAKARKKKKLTDVNGQAHIHSTINNTIVTITDLQGNCIT